MILCHILPKRRGWVKRIKEYYTFTKAPEHSPHDQMLFYIIPSVLMGILISQQRFSRHMLQPSSTGRTKLEVLLRTIRVRLLSTHTYELPVYSSIFFKTHCSAHRLAPKHSLIFVLEPLTWMPEVQHDLSIFRQGTAFLLPDIAELIRVHCIKDNTRSKTQTWNNKKINEIEIKSIK